jgi:hypothetical protein
MPIPSDLGITFQRLGARLNVLPTIRAICPHCRQASTFEVIAQCTYNITPNKIEVHLICGCNFNTCGRIVFVYIRKGDASMTLSQNDEFFMYPSRDIDPRHPAIPTHIAEDWEEAQKAISANAIKAAAVMCRRVLYGVLLDKNAKHTHLRMGYGN